ncbi:MAG: Gfo/Idh/MocA family oxidoreductase, partial [Paenibacillaceae bacterium]|nr:Gfo/Idh/MocA family oxidoreductase [Paenibacillaceae bacterium]
MDQQQQPSFQAKDGMSYAPKGRPNAVVKPGEFVFAAVALDHGHIYGMAGGLIEAGATLKWVYDPDPAKVQTFVEQFPQAARADSLEQVLADPEVRLVAAAAVPSERGPLGLKVMDAGKDYFTDKTPFTQLEQLEAARRKVRETGRKYMVYYSERLHVESAVYAGQLVQQGAIGRVLQVTGFGPHRLNAGSRPEWFF